MAQRRRKAIYQPARWPKVLGFSVLAVIVIMILIALGSALWLSTPMGRGWLTGMVNARLEESGIIVGALDGSLWSDFLIHRIEFHDEAGIYLDCRRITIRWTPISLIKGQLDIRKLDIETAHLTRLPESREDSKGQENGLFNFALPSLPFAVELSEATLDDLKIGPTLIPGEPHYTLTLQNVRFASDQIAGSLDLKDRQADTTSLTARLDFQRPSETLRLAINGKAAKDSAIARLIPIEAQTDLPLSFALEGAGPLTKWSGTIRTALAPDIALTTRITSEKTILSLTGKALIAGLTGEELRPLFRDALPLAIEADFGDDAAIPVTLNIGIPAIKADLTAKTTVYPQNMEALYARYSLSIKDDEALYPLTSGLSFENLSLTGTLEGQLDDVLAEAQFSLIGPAHQSFGQAESVTGTIGIRKHGQTVSAKQRAIFDGLILSDFPAGSASLTFDATANLASDIPLIAIETLEVEAFDAQATVSGQVSADLAQIDLISKLTAKRLDALPFTIPATGALEAETTAERINAQHPLAITLTAKGADIAPTDGDPFPFLGSSPHLQIQANIRREDEGDRIVSIESLAFEGDTARLTMSGAFNLDKEATDFSYRASFDNLSGLDLPSTFALDGGFVVDGMVKGPLSSLFANATTHLDTLSIQSVALSNLRLSLTGNDLLGTPHLSLESAGQTELGPVSLRAEADFAQDGAIALPRLRLALGEAIFTGALNYGADKLIRGSVSGEMQTLSQQPGSEHLDFRGMFDLRADFYEQNGQQGLKTNVMASGLSLPTPDGRRLHADSLHLKGDLIAGLPYPGMDISLNAQGVRIGFSNLDQFDLTAKSSGRTVDVEGSVSGHWRGPLDLAGALTLQEEGEDRAIKLNLDGQVFGQSVQTADPLHLSLYENGWRLYPAALRIGPGRVEVQGERSNDRAAFEAQVMDLPLQLANVLSPHLLPNGALDASLTASHQRGFPPTAQMQLSLRDVTPTLSGFAQIPTLQLQAKAALAANTLSLSGDAGTADVIEASFALDLPITIDLLEPAFQLSPDAAIDGQINWDGDMAPLFMIFNLPQHEAGGQLSADIALTGTIDQPNANGSIALQNGVYEHLESGFLANSIEASARLMGHRIEIERFQASDGESGEIQANGSAEITPDGDFLTDISLHLEEATVMRRVDVKAKTSADLRFSKSEDRADLSGSLNIERAEVDIAQTGGEEIATLEVEDLQTTSADQFPASEQAQQGRAETPSPLFLDLSITAPRRLFVRGRGLDSEWKAEIKISGTDETPIIEGEAQLVRGAFEFAGSRFQLDSGRLIFTGDAKPDPILDVRASERVDDIDIELYVSGTVSSPRLSLSATPSLPEDEILARLLFGESVADLSPLQAIQLASALASLSGGGGLDVIGTARSALGLDRLNVQAGNGDEAGARISGGKYLSDDVYLEVSTETGTGVTAAILEWAFTKSLSVQSRVSSSQENAISLRWSWSY